LWFLKIYFLLQLFLDIPALCKGRSLLETFTTCDELNQKKLEFFVSEAAQLQLNFQKILIPYLFLKDCHFCCALVDSDVLLGKTAMIELFDSFGTPNIVNQFKEGLLLLFTLIGVDSVHFNCSTIVIQKDAFNCGFFVCFFLLYRMLLQRSFYGFQRVPQFVHDRGAKLLRSVTTDMLAGRRMSRFELKEKLIQLYNPPDYGLPEALQLTRVNERGDNQDDQHEGDDGVKGNEEDEEDEGDKGNDEDDEDDEDDEEDEEDEEDKEDKEDEGDREAEATKGGQDNNEEQLHHEKSYHQDEHSNLQPEAKDIHTNDETSREKYQRQLKLLKLTAMDVPGAILPSKITDEEKNRVWKRFVTTRGLSPAGSLKNLSQKVALALTLDVQDPDQGKNEEAKFFALYDSHQLDQDMFLYHRFASVLQEMSYLIVTPLTRPKINQLDIDAFIKDSLIVSGSAQVPRTAKKGCQLQSANYVLSVSQTLFSGPVDVCHLYFYLLFTYIYMFALFVLFVLFVFISLLFNLFQIITYCSRPSFDLIG
jgi:hypothetical protein